MTNKGEVVVQTETTNEVGLSVISNVFQDIDFTTLNSSITALATHNGNLSTDDKKFAVETISVWESSVIGKLIAKQREANSLLSSLHVGRYIDIGDDVFENLVIASNTEDLYEDYLKIVEEIIILKENAPVCPVEDLTKTLEERLEESGQYQVAFQKFDVTIRKKQRDAENAMIKLKKKMNEHNDIKELIKRVTQYQKKVNTFKAECVDKAQLAKINVTISSDEIRAALSKLLDFSVNI